MSFYCLPFFLFVVPRLPSPIKVWDMSVEEDAEASMGMGTGAHALPPQLLFIHHGQTSIKELHFHPQVPGVLMTTALDGFNVFKPAANI